MPELILPEAVAGGHPPRFEVDPPPRLVDPADPHRQGVPEPDRSPVPGPDEHRSLLVELPPVPAQLAHGQHPLELPTVAEHEERPGADQPHDLPLERLILAIALRQGTPE